MDTQPDLSANLLHYGLDFREEDTELKTHTDKQKRITPVILF